MIELLHSVITGTATLELRAKTAVEALLTFEGRAPLEHRLPALGAFDRAIYDTLPPGARMTREAVREAGAQTLRIYFNQLGRLHIRRDADPLCDYGLGEPVQAGFLSLPGDVIANAEAEAARRRREDLHYSALFDHALTELERAGELAQLLDEVEDSVRHVEAVCFYVDDCRYSVMERATNLVSTRKGPGLIDELRKLPVAQWRPCDRVAIASLRALFLCGGSVRFEEFNAIEISAKRVLDCLHRLAGGYRTALQRTDELPAGLFDLGRYTGALARSLDGEAWLRYRRVNGITFQKQENLIPLVDHPRTNSAIRSAFHGIRQQWHRNSITEPRAFFVKAAEDAIDAHCSGGGSDLERLIEDIVGSAVRATGSDYGMSSSLRQPGILFGADQAEIATRVGDLTTKDFYCCIVGTPEMRERFGERLSGDVFRAVQARMQFNRWHFVPGNLPRAQVRPDRHYFYPPVMPDMAEWVDQFHAGHVRAGVRYSIRAPGPEILEPPLTIAGQDYRGFYDVRVVRVAGAPFAIHDLRLVREHSKWMGVVWRTIVRRCAEADIREQLRVTGFVNGTGAILEPVKVAATA